jgi:hypothetical protein
VRWSRSFSKPRKQKKHSRGLPPAPRRIDAFSRITPDILAVLDSPESTVEARVEACRSLIRFGELGRVVTYLSAMLEDPVLEAHARLMFAEIRTLRRLGVENAARPRRNRGMQARAEDLGYWVVPAGSTTTVVAFTGMAMRLDISIYFMQRILKRFGVNVIYVFDWTNTYYFGGVKGLGGGTRMTAAGLRRMCAKLGTERLICFGQSSGGYAAIRYGVKLKADGVLAFSPVILPVMKSPIVDQIETTLGLRPERRRLDLRQVMIREREIPYTKIVYGDANRADVRSARHISDLPNVAEHVLPGVSYHGTVEATTLTGEFPEIFRTFCEEVGPGRWATLRRGTSYRRSPGSPAHAGRRSPAAEGWPR